MTAAPSLADTLPRHWQLKRLKFIARVQTGVAKGKDHADADTVEVPYLRVANVQDGYLALDDVATMAVPVADLERYRLQPGDVLMNEGGDFDKLGRGHVWHGQIDPCIHQNHVFAVRPHGVSPEWLNAWTGSAPAQFYFMGRAKQSTNLASISSSNVMELPVPVPPPEEQVARVAFIARETSRIDALIAKKTRFIALLREKRQALIAQAVTRGLDPDVAMKDSGVDWLGRMPVHWRIVPLKWIAAIGNGSTPSREEPDFWVGGTIPWLTSSVVNSGEVSNAEEFVTEKALTACHLPIINPPAVLVGLTGQGRTRGMATVLRTRATISQHLAFIKPKELEISVGYLARFFEMAYPRIRYDSEGAGSTKGAVTCEQLGEHPVLVPPPREQSLIVEHISQSVTAMNELAQTSQRSVALLKEHRSALITATVTGQIDIGQSSDPTNCAP